MYSAALPHRGKVPLDGKPLCREQGSPLKRDNAGNYPGSGFKRALYDCMAFGAVGAGYFSSVGQGQCQAFGL